MFECSYCTTIFPKLPVEGGCPRCGAPRPKLLDPEIRRVVETTYVYVPQRDYYTPRFTSSPIRATRSSFFGALGYRLALVVLIVLIVGLVVSFVSWLNYRTAPLSTTDPSWQQTLPTALPKVQAPSASNPWEHEQWLSSGDARKLREQKNVVNLAYLEDGAAKYSATHSIGFFAVAPWKQTKPLGMTALTRDGTSIRIIVRGQEYVLNVLQPFILASQPEKVVVVDSEGAMWQADVDAVSIEVLESVVRGLVITIAPNPNLSITY